MGTSDNSDEDQLVFAYSGVNFYGSVSNLSSVGGCSQESTEKVRARLKWHYMNAYEKYKAGGRKPWKLLVQIIKILLVTGQVIWFGDRRFSVVNYLDDTNQVFEHLFLLNSNVSSDSSLYTKNDLYNQINFTAFQYENMDDITLGAYGYTCGENSVACPVQMCINKYNSTINPSEFFYYFASKTPVYSCRNITSVPSANMSEFLTQNNIPNDFHTLLFIELSFSLQTIKIEQLRFGNSPQCVRFHLKLKFNNAHHTGKFHPKLKSERAYKECNVGSSKMKDEKHYGVVAYDIIVILVCFWSFVLTTRSFVRNIRLALFTFNFFKVHRQQKLSILSDGTELVNMWFFVILLTDILTIVGSVIKIYIDTTNLKESYFFDVCSLCLGIAVLFIWIGILRYLGFLEKYNVLLITLEASFPSVLRFLSCAGILYLGFLFCGWIVFGPYHPKFSTLSEVSECLFSLVNGDDMFMTFREMHRNNYELWIFSKIYLYLFISLFIYVVISLFIGIISDTYERLKSGEHISCSRLKMFIHGPECHCHSRSEMVNSIGNAPLPEQP